MFKSKASAVSGLLLWVLATNPAATLAKETNVDGVVLLESFENPEHTWEVMNDPVMGGRSKGTFNVEEGVGKFQGEVVDVPFLKAPGFLQARTISSNFPDVSHCTALELICKSNVDYDYKGYRVSFGNAHAPGGKWHAYGYKATLTDVPYGDDGDFTSITIPFEDFTDFWDDATGDPIHTCQENPLYCPDELTLKNMRRLAIWAEGVAGKVDLEIQSIQAVGCAAAR